MRKDFVANVSHDLRSPLTSIQGFLTALLDGTVPPGRRLHYLLLMKDGTERLIKLVDDLLDLARIEAGQMKIAPVPFNLTELVRQAIARMEPLFLRKQLQVRLLADEEREIKTMADPDRIDQVMINLMQNAIQFSPDGATVEVVLTRKDNRAVIAVRDYGTGIGLSIVKHILDLHETSIDVDSVPGKGTTFIFTLPLL